VSRQAVFDAMVFLQAVASPSGPSGACFAHVRSGTLALITSPETVAELQGLLARPTIRKKFPHLSDQVAEELVTEVERISISIENVPRVLEYPRDPKDEPYINLAIATHADYLTSRDKDLLDLMNDRDFTTRFPGLRVLDPASLLRELELEQASEQIKAQTPNP
jgi:putative PIN family toxin of toxin-antitoxin system